MRITQLVRNPQIYSSNAYLVRGDKNCLEDVNTLIDTGVDKSVVDAVRAVYTGVGKRAVDQVILTHSHFDHVGGTAAVKGQFGASVLGFGTGASLDRALGDGEVLRVGDRDCTIIHCIEHSQDSILIYESSGGILFSGDTPLDIKSVGGEYHRDYLRVLDRLVNLHISVVYPGHGAPMANADAVILRTREIVRQCTLI